MNVRRWTSAGLACISALFALGYCLSPIDVSRSDITWTPTSGEAPSAQLRLAAQTPDQLHARFDCQQVSRVSTEALNLVWSDTRVFNTMDSPLKTGLGLFAQKDRLWVAFNDHALDETLLTYSPGAGCVIELSYSRDHDLVTLTAGTPGHSQTTSSPLTSTAGGSDQQPLQVTKLTITPGMLGYSTVNVTTAPTGFHSDWWRWALAAASCLAALFSVIALRKFTPPAALDQRFATEPAPSRWAWSDTVVSAIAMCAMFIVPPAYDDGWVLGTVRQYNDLGYFSNYFWEQASPQPQGFWWEWFQHLWLSDLGTPAFLLRAPAAALIVITWWFLRRRVLSHLDGRRRSLHFFAALVYCCGFVSFLITLRPEPMIALLVTVAMSLAIRYYRQSDPWVLAAMGLVSAAALAAHQTGWCVLTCCLSVTPRALSEARRIGYRRASITLATIVFITASTASVLAMLGTNAVMWFRSVATFAHSASYQGTLQEARRVESLLQSGDTGAGRLFVASLAVLLIIGFLTRRNREFGPTSVAGWAAICSIIGLVLTSSKLSAHIGAIVPATAVLAAIVGHDLAYAQVSKVRIAVVSLALLSVGLAVTNPLVTGQRNTELLDAEPSLSSVIPTRWLSVSSPLLWVVVIACAIGAAWLIGRSTINLKTLCAAGLITAVSSLCVSVGLLPSLYEAGNPASWVGQQVGALTGKSCGLAGEAGALVPTSVKALPGNQVSTDLLPGYSGATTTPITLAPLITNYQSRAGSQGLAGTPWFTLDVGKPTIAWISSSTLGTVTYQIQFRDSQGHLLPAHWQTRASFLSVWQVIPINAPSTAVDVRVVWHSEQGNQVVTGPVAIDKSQTLRQAAGDGPVWNNPQTYLQASCLPLPSIANGITAPFNWSLGTPLLLGEPSTQQAYEVGCPTLVDVQATRCAVAVVNSPPEAMTVTKSITRQ